MRARTPVMGQAAEAPRQPESNPDHGLQKEGGGRLIIRTVVSGTALKSDTDSQKKVNRLVFDVSRPLFRKLFKTSPMENSTPTYG